MLFKKKKKLKQLPITKQAFVLVQRTQKPPAQHKIYFPMKKNQNVHASPQFVAPIYIYIDLTFIMECMYMTCCCELMLFWLDNNFNVSAQTIQSDIIYVSKSPYIHTCTCMYVSSILSIYVCGITIAQLGYICYSLCSRQT